VLAPQGSAQDWLTPDHVRHEGCGAKVVQRFMRIGVVAQVHARGEPRPQEGALALVMQFGILAGIDEGRGCVPMSPKSRQQSTVDLRHIGRVRQIDAGHIVEGQRDLAG